MKGTFGLLHFYRLYLRFLFTSDKFARGILLQRERASFMMQKDMS